MTYSEVIPIWWSYFWRATLAGTIAGFVLGGIAGALAAMMGQPQNAAIWGGIAGFLIGIPISIWAMMACINLHQLKPADS